MANLCTPVRCPYYHLDKASRGPENRAKYSNIREAKGKLAEIGRARNRLPDFVLVQGISIANEITGTYRSGIRPDGLLGFGLVTSRPRSLCSLDDDQTRKRVLRANVFAAALFRPRNFDRLPDRRRATRSFPSFSFQFRKISFEYRVISFLLYTQYSLSLFLLCFIQLGNLNSLGEVM